MASVYESPVINKLQNGMMNKFGRSPAYARKVCDAIHGISIDELARQFGSPLFVYSEQRIRALYREAYGAFSRRYPNVMFAWSYKTNYLAAICAIMHSEGAIAEVVSEMEYVKARAMGIPGNQIIFNGPHKPVGVLAQAVREGAIINVDHLDEICDLEATASSQGRRIQVGLRINLDAGIYPQWSRFGFNLESGQALDAIKRIANGGQLIPNGLHCHLGTFIVEPAAYARQIEKMIYFAYELEDQFGFTIDYLDIGGGLPSQNRLKATYLPPEVAVPSIEEFAERIGDGSIATSGPATSPPDSRIDALIDEGGSLITTVEATKRLPTEPAYVVDAG